MQVSVFQEQLHVAAASVAEMRKSLAGKREVHETCAYNESFDGLVGHF